MPISERGYYEFGPFQMTVPELELTQHGRAVYNLAGTALKVLKVLVERAGTLITKQQILDTVWGEQRAVELGNVDVHIYHIRQIIDADNTDPESYIKPVHGRGVVFTLPVHWFGPDRHLAATSPTEQLLPEPQGVETLCPSFEIIPPQASCLTASSADAFYDGFAPTWPDLKAVFDVQRAVYAPATELRRLLSSVPTSAAPVQIALIGVAGTGKTTLLRRIGFDTADAGFTVLRLREDWYLNPASLATQIRLVADTVSSPVVTLIDNAGDLVFEHNTLDATLHELRQVSPTNPIVLILAEEANRWYPLTRRARAASKAHLIRIHQLLQSECERLVDKMVELEKQQRLTAFTALSRDQRLALCEGRAQRQLLVAMLQMRHGEELRSIIKTEFERIPFEPAQRAYGLVCHFNTLGFLVPKQTVLRAVGIDNASKLVQFHDSTSEILVQQGVYSSGRHDIIARAVARHAWQSPASRQAAILEILKSLDPEDQVEYAFMIDFFTRYRIHRTLAVLFERDMDVVKAFYRTVRHILASRWPQHCLKYVATCEGLSAHFSRDMTHARECFLEAEALDPTYELPVRRHAWLEHEEGNWNEAARLAEQAANLQPDNFDTVFQCGLILSFNTVGNFRRARRYLEKAFELDPDNLQCKRRLEEYQDAETVMSVVTNLYEDQIIPKYVLKALRPGLSFFRAAYGPTDQRFRMKLRSTLRVMAQEVHGEVGDLHETLAGIDPKNQIDRALVYCNLGRLMYLEWYQRGEPHDAEHIQSVFEASLDLNPKDPFTHCWYGTFLKETRRDLKAARREYETALRLGNSSRDERLTDHPLFLNNIALLTLDEVQARVLPVEQALEARSLLERAVARVVELESDFYWPQHSLDYCDALIRECGVGDQ